jgi:hypothetical protein
MYKHLKRTIATFLVIVSCVMWRLGLSLSGQADALEAARRAVPQILRADYEGDRAALGRLHDDLQVANGPPYVTSRVLYWRGFALWRRAMNGFNDGADTRELQQDMEQAVREFEDALARDSGFVDARLGMIACLQGLTFLSRDDQVKVQELATRWVQPLKDSLAAAPENPRLLWVYGGSQWYAIPGLSESQIVERQKAGLATFARGLEFARKQKGTIKDLLEPSWGEPELLMNLAWANLNARTPDIAAAERYAKEALELVPYWHYVRDILMPKIRAAKDKG